MKPMLVLKTKSKAKLVVKPLLSQALSTIKSKPTPKQAYSQKFIDFLDKAQLPYMHYDHVSNKLIVVVDNHLMQTYRACPSHFELSAIQGQHKKSNTREGEKQRIWFLDFGIVLHKMFELYYRDFRNSNFEVTEWAITRANHEWNEMQMNVHAGDKEFQLIGGVKGFAMILIQYSTLFTPINEKLRILGSEISFGRAKEVPLFIGENLEIYLAGRMDLIIDDGYFICPMDHKSEGKFRGDPGLKYETDEGPTGYVYTLSKILPSLVPKEEILKRDCSKILMNLIQKTPTDDPRERFKRIPIRKTSWQLEEYRKRMCTTVVHLIKDMERYAQGIPFYRNTMVCSNWFHRDCVYRDVHRQGSADGEQNTLYNGYVKLPIWNTEEVKPTT